MTDVRAFFARFSTYIMNKEAVLHAYQAFKSTQRQKHIQYLRNNNPKFSDWTDAEITKVYVDCVSCFQSKSGTFFEQYIEDCLRKVGVPFRAQVHINNEGVIVQGGGKTIADIVFGEPKVGTHISSYSVLSLKTTSRERAKQDAWTYKYPPKVFYYGTIEADYPQPSTFQESAVRKLVCVQTRAKDERQFKFGFPEMVDEVRLTLGEQCSAQACR